MTTLLSRGLRLAGFLAIAGTCSGCQGADAEPFEEVEYGPQEIFANTLVWNQIVLTNPPARDGIPVCFELNGGSYAVERQWVEYALTRTWASVSKVKFYGYGVCANNATPGFHIVLSGDATSGVVPCGSTACKAAKVGTQFPSADCQGTSRELCVRTVAVHEVGHLLGAGDEYRHPLIPASCSSSLPSNSLFWVGSAPDYQSVMYGMANCSQTTRTAFMPTAKDMRGMRILWGAPSRQIALSWVDAATGQRKWWFDIDGTRKYESAEDSVIAYGEATAQPVAGIFSVNRTDYIARMGTFLNGTWKIDWNANGSFATSAGDKTAVFGITGDIAAPGRYTGGQSLLAVWRPSNGTLCVDLDNSLSSTSADRCTTFVAPQTNMRPVVGDWTNTGVERFGIYRNGVFYVDINGDRVFGNGDVTYTFIPKTAAGTSITNGTPLAADFYSTGKTTLAVYYAGVLYEDANDNKVWDGASVDRRITLGLTGVPLVGHWRRVTALSPGQHPE